VGNLAINGSFTSNEGSSVTAPGWSTAGATPDVNDAVGTVNTSAGYNWTGTPLPSSDGGTWQNLFSSAEQIEQTITVVPGQAYSLSFEYAAQGISSGSNTYIGPVGVQVLIDGNVVHTTPDDQTQFTWESACFSFTATSNSVTIRLTPTQLNYVGIDGFCLVPGVATNTINLGNDTTLCQGQTLLLSAGPTGGNYVWQDNSNVNTFNVTNSGTYWVASNNGCQIGTDTIVVNYSNASAVDLGNDTTLCTGAALLLDATLPNATYQWQDNSTNSSFNVTQAGTYWVSVASTCPTVDSISVDFESQPTLELGNDTSICPGETVLLQPTSSSDSYLWQDNSVSPSYLALNPGNYWVTVTSLCGSITDSVHITLNTVAPIDLGNDTTLCQGETVNLDVTTPNATYAWQDNSSISSFTVVQAGTYWVELNGSFCPTFDTINVTYNQLANVNLGNDTSLCEGESLTISLGQANYSYLWSDNSVGTGLNITSTGTYWVAGTNMCSTAVDSIDVSYNPLPEINLGNDTALCLGETLTLDAFWPNSTYQWQDNSTNSAFNVAQQGSYWVYLNLNGCTYSDTVLVTYNGAPTVELGNDTVLCFGEKLLLNATYQNATYLWQDNSTSSTFEVKRPGIYSVQVSECGTTTDFISVEYEHCDCYLYVPNTFTPNSDGVNDLFNPQFNCDFTSYDLKVFNRWGQELFFTNDEASGWDGSVKGKQAPIGVYAFQLIFQFEEKEELRRLGRITLKR
jgi:gliding motility-associated-like protein